MKPRSLVVLGLSLLYSASAFAQGGGATITGTVTDQTGAVVPETPISVRHVATGTVTNVASTAAGNFTVANLQIGTYEVRVEHPGFKTYQRGNILLSAAQTLRVDVVLEVGSQTDTVTVTAETSMMKTDSGEVVHNITMREIQNLPMIPVTDRFRDPFAVVQLLPGVRYTTQSQMIVNGLPQSTVQYRIEGQVMGNARGLFVPITGQVQPSVDAIQEVSIQTSNYAAEFGSVGGALFNVTMRSGTNQYHGSVYDYAVNEVLNAHDPGTHRRDRIRRHDWGFTGGGPIKLPKIYDGTNKSFFFWSYERYNQNILTQSNANQPTVPTQAYRDGDFSTLPGLSGNRNLTIGTGANERTYLDPFGNPIQAGTLFDPFSLRQVTCTAQGSGVIPGADCGGVGNTVNFRDPLSGNRIPASWFDPVAMNIQNKYIPLPTGPRAANGEVINNYEVPVNSQRLSIIPSLKLDHNLNAKSRISALWQFTQSTAPIQAIGGAEGFEGPITQNRGTYQTSNSLRINFDQTITPTLQLRVGAAYSLFDWSDATLITDYNPAEDIGLIGVRQNRNFPRFAANTQTSAGVGLGGMNAMGPAGQALNPERRPSGTVGLTWIRGNHTIKVGSDWRMDMLPQVTYSNTAGNFGALTNGNTWQPALQGLALSGATNIGFPYAEFLMGNVRSFEMSTPISYRVSKQQWGLFLQDSWRVSRKLTLDYGIRWDYGTYSKEDYGRNGALSLSVPNPSAGGHPGGAIYEATCNCAFARNYPYGVGPRLGLAYTLNPKTVIRGGFGVSYASTGTFSGSAQNSANAPSLVNGFVQDWRMGDGIPSSINPQWPTYEPNPGHPNNAVLNSAPAMLDPNAGRPSRIYQWNISVQREITRTLVIEASYVANRGVWQPAAAMVDHNARSEQLINHYGFTIGNLADQTMLNKQISALTAAERSILTARGVGVPWSGFPTNQTVLQSLRPMPQYNATVNPAAAPLGKSWYDALQITINKRYSNGLMVNANYTLAKNLSARAAPDVFNWNYGNKDLDALNQPQQLRVAFEYQVPFISKDTPVFGNAVVRQVLGGWGVGMSLQYVSGAYIGRPNHGATNPISQWLGRGPGGAQLKKDAFGGYMSPWSVDWVDTSGRHRTDPLDINCRCFDQEKTIVLNPNAWEAVPDGQWAADALRVPFFRGTRRPQENGNLSRNFRFGNEGRYTLQIRMEFQNVFNRLLLPATPQLGNFNTPPTEAQTTPDGRYTGGFGTLGNLRSGTAYGPERSGMLVGRFSF